MLLIGQTVEVEGVQGHVVLSGKKVRVRTAKKTIELDPSTAIKVISDEALPLEVSLLDASGKEVGQEVNESVTLLDASGTQQLTSPTKVRKHRAGTKYEAAVAIYKDASDKTRKDVIQLFVEKLNMTPAGASTYYAMCKHG